LLRKIKKGWHGLDVVLLVAVITLLAFGLLMVYSASWQYSFLMGQSYAYLFNRQLIWAAAGIAIAAGLSFIDYHKIRRLVVPIMYCTLFMLILVLFFVGETRWGSKRSLIGGSIQPTELAKLAIIVYLSFWINSKKDVLNKFSFGLLPLMGILGITAGLVLVEPDISAAATIVFLGGVLFFIGGGDLKQIVLILVAAALIGSLVVAIYPTGRTRLNDYIAGARNPQNASYQVKRSMEAIVHGGIFGVGIGQSSTKFTGFPSRRLIHLCSSCGRDWRDRGCNHDCLVPDHPLAWVAHCTTCPRCFGKIDRLRHFDLVVFRSVHQYVSHGELDSLCRKCPAPRQRRRIKHGDHPSGNRFVDGCEPGGFQIIHHKRKEQFWCGC